MPHPQDILSTAFALQQQGDAARSEQTLRTGLRQWPNDAGICYALASLLAAHARPSEAVFFAQRAADLLSRDHADDPKPLTLLGTCLVRSGKLAPAETALRKALALAPDHTDALNALACCYLAQHRSDEALPLMERCVGLDPDNAAYGATYAAVLIDHARAEEGLTVLQRSAERAPRHVSVLVTCASAALYTDRLSPMDKLALATRAGASIQHAAAQLPPIAPPLSSLRTSKDTQRPLRVGLLSNDFRQHSCAYFLMPLLRTLSPRTHAVSLHAFSLFEKPDDVTRRMHTALREQDGSFYDCHALQPHAIASLIAREQIDLLIDLGGYSAGSGIETLALRPASLQATWLGYPGTTGLPSIDFRIVDNQTDPLPDSPQAADPQRWHSERLARLDRCFLCYDRERLPAATRTPRPADASAPITFGSFNAPAKISSTCLDLWASVLRAVPNSRLLLKGSSLASDASRGFLAHQLEARGVAPSRLECIGRTATVAAHLALYDRVDIALDTYPYHGTTTTCEALSMGVPVITLAGVEHAARVGASILTAIAMPDLIAHDSTEFVALASRLAGDGVALHDLHATLPDRVRASPLCDDANFADAFSRLLHIAWEKHWAKQPPEGQKDPSV